MTAFHIVFGGDLNRVPVETVVLVEALVFSGDDGVLQIGRDLAERDEVVAFAVGLVMYPGLQAAFDVYSAGWRVDPAESDKQEHGQQPEKSDDESKPSKRRPKEALPAQRLWKCGWACGHISG